MNINIDYMIQKVTDTLTTKTVIGEPMEIGEVVLIPVMNASFGFGAGGGDGRMGSNDQGSGAGGGGGARLSVSGMIVIKGGNVSFIPTGKSAGKGGAIEKIIDALPDLIDKVNIKTGTKNGRDDGDSESEDTQQQ